MTKAKPKAGENWIICEIGHKLKGAKQITLLDQGVYAVTIDNVNEDGSLKVSQCSDGMVEDGVSKRRCLALMDSD